MERIRHYTPKLIPTEAPHLCGASFICVTFKISRLLLGFWKQQKALNIDFYPNSYSVVWVEQGDIMIFIYILWAVCAILTLFVCIVSAENYIKDSKNQIGYKRAVVHTIATLFLMACGPIGTFMLIADLYRIIKKYWPHTNPIRMYGVSFEWAKEHKVRLLRIYSGA